MDAKPSETHEKKIIVLVGDKGVGKTSLIRQNIRKIADTEVAEPSPPSGEVSQPVAIEVERDKNKIILEIWEMDEQDEGRGSEIYSEADIFIICFSHESSTSLKNATEKWIPELCRDKQPSWIYLLGLKQNENCPEIIDDDQGNGLAREIGAWRYRSIALDHPQISTLFEDISGSIVTISLKHCVPLRGRTTPNWILLACIPCVCCAWGLFSAWECVSWRMKSCCCDND